MIIFSIIYIIISYNIIIYYNIYYYPAAMMFGGRFDPVTLSVNMNFYLY